MDPNKPAQPATTTQIPVATPTPVPPPQTAPAPVMVQNVSSKSHKKLIWSVVIILVLILLAGGGWYFYSTNMNPPQSEVINAPSGTTVGEEFKTLESEVNNTPIDDVDAQFTEVDKDLQKL